jgi:fructose-1,6-bisphosphatase/inositol monophosphatase family enzyme
MEAHARTLEQLSGVVKQVHAVRIFASPALALAAGAAGWFELFFRSSTKPTIWLGLVFMVRAAGGKAVDYAAWVGQFIPKALLQALPG